MIIPLTVTLNFLPFLLCIPESAIVYPTIVQTRDTNSPKHVNIDAFETNYDLRLEPSDIFSEDFVLRSIENGKPVDRSLKDLKIADKLFIDRRNQASLYIDENEHGPRVEGIIGDYYIKPSFIQRRYSANSPLAHTLTRIERSSTTYDFKKSSTWNNKEKRNRANTNHVIPSELTIELVVVVDKLHYSLFGDCEDTTAYVAAFVNAANFPYNVMENPKIKLVLNGIVCNTNNNMEPYVVNSLENGYLKESSLEKFERYMEDKEWTFTYDIAVLITGHLIKSVAGQRIGGASALYTMCTPSSYAIVDDSTATFLGVPIMAHEIAHTLGISHDGVKRREQEFGFPPTDNCKVEDGYLMGDNQFHPEGYHFSSCSIKQLRFSLKKKWQFDCLTQENPVHHNTDYENILPYDVMPDLNDICSNQFPNIPNVELLTEENSPPCTGVCCNGEECYEVQMLDGTPCGRRKICRFGVCMARN